MPGPADDQLEPAAGDPGAFAGLPEAAGRRLGQGAWSSGLSVADLASCLALGMEPVGFVQGYAVMAWSWYQRNYGMTMGSFGGMPGGSGGGYQESFQCPHGFVSAEHRTWGYNAEQAWLETSWATGWGLAFSRMMEEAVDAGAHGVIGVVDQLTPLLGASTVEFSIQGTAVAVPGAPVPSPPFSTYLSGQRLAKLLEAGFAPVSVVATTSSVQMIGYCITAQQLSGAGSFTYGGTGLAPITQVDRAQEAARALARERIRRQLGGDILHGAELETSEYEIGEAGLTIQCSLKGTRVRQFKDFSPIEPPTPVVRLR